MVAYLAYRPVNGLTPNRSMRRSSSLPPPQLVALAKMSKKLPFNVQVSSATDLARSQVLDLTDFLATNLGSVNINSAQSNPLQPDVQYRGYAASPLLGLSQGIAVYQNGSRINEPFGDAVNWDLIPQSAIQSH